MLSKTEELHFFGFFLGGGCCFEYWPPTFLRSGESIYYMGNCETLSGCVNYGKGEGRRGMKTQAPQTETDSNPPIQKPNGGSGGDQE